MARKSQGNLRIVQGLEMFGLSKPRIAYPRISQLRLMVGDKDNLSQDSLAQADSERQMKTGKSLGLVTKTSPATLLLLLPSLGSFARIHPIPGSHHQVLGYGKKSL